MRTNCEIRYASHPEDARQYTTERLRQEYLVKGLMQADEVNMVYSMYDRLIVGGAVPVKESLPLNAIDELKAEYFLERRELGIINVGGKGIVEVEDEKMELDYKEALYIGKGVKKVVFHSADAADPARFYFNSAPAHMSYPTKKITKNEAIVIKLGSLEDSNQRVINKLLVSGVIKSCQLQMGMTELQPGSIWNTMPVHTHDRRMEAYFYFELPPQHAICHFMGETDATRHLWMHNEEAVISPVWSIHSAAGTHNYTFIWGMAGENLDYNDMDACQTLDLK